MRPKFPNQRLFAGISAATVACAAVGMSLYASTANQDSGNQGENQVATYQPQQAFQQYHRAEELTQEMQELRMEMQQAQQEGDNQRAMQLQQQMQQRQEEIVDAFYSDVENALPAIADENDIKIVAVEIAYVDPEFGEPEDITQQIMDKVNDGASSSGQQGGEPGSQPRR